MNHSAILGLISLRLIGELTAQCQTSQGNAHLALVGNPAAGNSIAFRSEGHPSAPALFALNSTPGPVTVAPWGTFCVAVDANLATLALSLSAQGNAELQVAGASTTALLGASFHAQTLVFDAAAPNGFFALSNGVSLTFIASSQIFSDDFESYALGSFPSTGGWAQYFGNAPGTVVAGGSSGAKSLRLVGSSCWFAEAYHALPLGTRTRYEVSVMATNMALLGCGTDMILVGYLDPAPCGTWGCDRGAIMFSPDGYIYGAGVQLQAFQTNHWYRCVALADFQAGTLHVEIDGHLFGPFPNSVPAVPPGIMIQAGHGQNPDPAVLFDDVRVFAQ